jgi:hypothetical protein
MTDLLGVRMQSTSSMRAVLTRLIDAVLAEQRDQ